MIIDKSIKMNITSRNITYYKNIGYDVTVGYNTDIKIDDLIKGSPSIIKTTCDICGEIKNMEYRTYINNTSDDGLYYCKKCKSIKIKKTKKERYGDENYNNYDKIKETNFKKYGVDHLLKIDSTIEKIKNTKKDRYGDENYNNYNKLLNTKRYRYGDKNYNNYDKYVETNIKKYGVDNVSKLDSNKEERKINKKKKIIGKYEKYGIIDMDYINYDFIYKCKNHISVIPKTIFYNRLKTNTTMCTICNPINNPISDVENQLLNFIKENYDEEIVQNNRDIIKPHELDIYLPDLNLAFEFNGLYWHSEIYKSNNYHKTKTELCENKGIQLIHIWEDNWNYKQNIIKSMILNKLNQTPTKIFGRKTEVREITDNKIVRTFLETNHLQGFVGSKVKLGLFFDNDLVSLMTFGKLRKSMGLKSKNNGDYEMLRFCNKLNTNVLGGASKLFKYFIKTYKPTEITSYADRSYSNGNLYKQIGFKLSYITSPNYYYVIDGIRHYRFGFRKDVLIKQGYNSNKTEHEIMLERKIYRIYNSGNYKFIKSMKEY